MGRLAVASINMRPDPGESPFKHFKELENALLDAEGKIEEDRSKLRERLKQAWLDKNDFSKDAAWFGPASAKFLVLPSIEPD